MEPRPDSPWAWLSLDPVPHPSFMRQDKLLSTPVQQQQVGTGDGTYFDCTMQPFQDCISMNFADSTGLDNFAWGRYGNCL